jgi:lipopolysaccharide assembly outer membrane protein LptD (OstA)
MNFLSADGRWKPLVALARLVPAVLLTVAALLAVGSVLTADRGAAQVGPESRPESRMQADRYIDRMVNGEPVSFMLGNVFIDRDSLTASSDSARYYRNRELYAFEGNVVVTRDSSTLSCQRGTYNRILGKGDFFGDVRLEDGGVIGTGLKGESRMNGRYVRLIGDALLVAPDYSVRADTIFRDRVTGVGQAFGRVQIMQPGAKTIVSGEHAIFSASGDTAEVDRDPVLVSREQQGGPLISTAGLMRFFRSEDRVVMVDSVRIRQANTRASADTAIAYGRERMVLRGSPQVSMSEGSTMFGDEIEFRYRGGQLRRVILTGSARMEDAAPDSLAAVYQGLPTMDILEGDSISVEFENQEIDRSVVVGNARSIYTPQDLQDEVATNDVEGDTIVINFREQKVKRVQVTGNMSGNYKFARVAAMREMLGRGKRLADMMNEANVDSAAVADTLIAAGVDSLIATMPTSLVDSLLTVALDSLAAAGFDTSAATMSFLSSAEDVKYRGGSVDFEMTEKSIDIRHDGELIYGSMKLTAQHIRLDTTNRELYAEGEPLVEDSETIAGENLGYNFKHKTGAVENGVTTFDNYYYVGDEIKRFPDTTLKICGGRMTSCDRAEPHYHFWSDKMKMRMEDKVVAAPIVLRIGNVPIFALPFYFKSLKEGRQSGILFPSFDFGWSSREGRYIRDFGYYWATNEYLDFIFEGDYNERRDFGYRISNRYVKRYTLNGGVDYSRKIGMGTNKRREWQLRWNHNQPSLLDDYKFRADVRLASTSLSSNDLTGSGNRDIVSGQLKSNVYLSRNYSFVNANLNANRDERVNATDEDPATDNLIYSMTLPSLSLNFPQFTLAPALRGGKGSFLGNLGRNTYFQQGYSFKADSKGYELHDVNNYNAGGNWSLSLRPPRVGIFNVSFSSSASHSWSRSVDKGQDFFADTDTTYHYESYENIKEDTNTGLSFSTGLGTTLYGLFPAKVGRLRAIRHTFRLNSGWSLRPGLSSGQVHSTSVSLSMDNRFDVKYLGAGSDSTMTEKKLDGLIDWSLGTNYSPKKEPGQRWGIISSGLTIKPGQSQALRLKVSNSIDPKTLSLMSTRFTYGLNFSGKLDVGEVAAPPEARRSRAIDRLGVDLNAAAADTLNPGDEFLDQGYEDNPEEFFDGEESSFYDFYDRQGRGQSPDAKDPTAGGRFIPFQVNTSISYNYTNATDDRRASGNFSVSADLTRGWKFRYQGSFDLVSGAPVRQQFSIKRDLHCWTMEFNRTISSVDSQFGFRIYLISIPALKFTRGVESGMSSPSGGYF